MLDTQDRAFISKEMGRHIAGSEARLMAVVATKEELQNLATSTKENLKGLATKTELKGLATKEDLSREIEGLAAMTQQGFEEVGKHMDEIRYRLGNVENKLDALAAVVEGNHDFDITKLKADVDKIKHRIGLP